MSIFFAKRFLTLLATLVGASVVIFVVMEILPGAPALVILETEATEESVKALNKLLGLDRPAHERYFSWIGGILQGDLGNSYAYRVPVWELVEGALQLTVPLAILSMILSVLLKRDRAVPPSANGSGQMLNGAED